MYKDKISLGIENIAVVLQASSPKQAQLDSLSPQLLCYGLFIFPILALALKDNTILRGEFRVLKEHSGCMPLQLVTSLFADLAFQRSG